MFSRLFGSSRNTSDDAAVAASPGAASSVAPFVLLVIQQDNYDWPGMFKTMKEAADRSLNLGDDEPPSPGLVERARLLSRLRVMQSSWEDVDVGPCDNYSSELRKRCAVTVKKQWINGRPVDNGPNGTFRVLTIFPDFLLIRNEVTTPERCHRAKLMGFMYGLVPCMNDILSILLMADRPIMHAMLNQLSVRQQFQLRDAPKKSGSSALTSGGAVAAAAAKEADTSCEEIPLIPQCFFPNTNGFFYGHTFPAVVKFGSAHAGVGKIKINDHHQMEDVRSLLVCTKEGHCLAEPFMEGAYDLRIQKIGQSIRVMKRQTCTGAWKTQTATCVLENLDTYPDRYRQWILSAAVMFGQGRRELDICTLDVLVEERTGKEYVLELNGTSSGWGHNAEEDNMLLADLLLTRMLSSEDARVKGEVY